jgi:23S rRNA pseudoU1915 N3-methylase RlmH
LEDYVKRIGHYAEVQVTELRDAARFKISLSTLTMPHQLARVLLAEQI